MNDSAPETSTAFPCIELPLLFRIGERADDIPWTEFREGVDIHRLYGDGLSGPTAALLRFRQDSRVPLHLHRGWEHILVLSGTQTDENGTIGPGTLRIHAPGTCHSVVSHAGCIVLAIYEKPVEFLGVQGREICS